MEHNLLHTASHFLRAKNLNSTLPFYLEQATNCSLLARKTPDVFTITNSLIHNSTTPEERINYMSHKLIQPKPVKALTTPASRNSLQ